MNVYTGFFNYIFQIDPLDMIQAFAIPFFIIGVFLVLISKKSGKIK